MIAVFVRFDVKPEVKKGLADTAVARQHLARVVEGCRRIKGLREKLFVMDPETSAQGALLLWETREDFEAYLKSPEYKETVLDICAGEPRVEVYQYTANLGDGVLF